MTDTHAFYRAFEDRLRGSRELILHRLQIYRPFLDGLQEMFPHPAALDIGCGRGEWLELLKDLGFTATGIDLDDGMLAACRQRGMAVEKGDGVARLAGMTDNSLALVSAFHVAEHLPFARLQMLIRDALRVLCPGGLLILETPNPENPTVGAHTFYLDPTHEKPLPPALLKFLPEYYGYHRTRVMRLQQGRQVADDTGPTLTNVLFDVSPDYAVVAQTTAKPEQVACLDALFDQSWGIDLHTLSKRYDTGLTNRFNDLETRFDTRIQDVLVRQIRAHEQLHQAHEQLRQVHEQERDALAAELKILYSSRSWRLTRPLRKAADLVRALRVRIQKIRSQRIVSLSAFLLLNRIDHLTRRLPVLRNSIAVLSRKPGLDRLVRFYHDTCMRRAAAAFDDQPLLSARHPKSGPAVWMPGKEKLSTEKLLERIRNEIRMTGNRNSHHDL